MISADGAESRMRLFSKRWERLGDLNATVEPRPPQACVHQLFELRVTRTPGATAVVWEGGELSYAELNARANQLARRLVELGVKPDVHVGCCLERTPELIVALLGILKAGGAYVPLDPAYPAERLRFMLEDSAPAVVLTHLAAREALETAMAGLEAPPAVLDVEAEASDGAEGSQANLEPTALGLTADHLAYVIYTSGSTGRPKGVMVEHRNLALRLEGVQELLGITEGDLIPTVASFAFDISLLETLLPLCVGASVQVLREAAVKNLNELVTATEKVTCLHAVPSLMSAWSEQLSHLEEVGRYGRLRTLLVGGEAVPQRLLLRLQAQFPGVEIVELYGPTETTVVCAAYSLLSPAEVPPFYSIGRPLPNTRIYILDEQMELVPQGVAGEIWVGGAGVARGYLNRPELTAERFVVSPFVAGDRIYQTGDLGRCLADGNIEFLGRNDDQVKIRGFRIELGEIEAKLAEHPAVGEAVVVAREDTPGDKRLAAYYTAAGPGPTVAGLRAHLRGLLPEHMVPAAYVRLEALPLNLNGKIDRKALPAPDRAAYAAQAYEAPQGAIEEALARIWADALGVERIGRHDDFFELGGNSLMAVWVLGSMRHAGLDLEAEAMFDAPTLSEMAAAARPFASAP